MSAPDAKEPGGDIPRRQAAASETTLTSPAYGRMTRWVKAGLVSALAGLTAIAPAAGRLSGSLVRRAWPGFRWA